MTRPNGVRKYWAIALCATSALTHAVVVSGLQQYGSRSDNQLLQPPTVLLLTMVEL